MRTRTIPAGAVFGAICLSFLAHPSPIGAQIDIAAIARFKYNQQRALAASLSKTQAGKQKSRDRKGKKTEVPAVKPPVIPAHNRTFKSNYGDMHTKNVR